MKPFKRMKKWAVICGMVLATTASAQREQWLEYHTSRDGKANKFIGMTVTPPPGVALPKLSAKPYFARWATPLDPTGGRWLCFDRSRPSGPYDRLYADSNGNGRLDDEQPVIASRRDPESAYFDPVRLVFKGEDGPITYYLALRFDKLDTSGGYQSGSSGENAFLLATSAGWYEGQVDFAGKKHRIQLIDLNLNGTYNDISPFTNECDRIVVDTDKGESRIQGHLLEVDDQMFRIEVARDGACVKVQKADDLALGRVQVPENISEVTVVGENGQFTRKPAKGEFTVPVGRYRVYRWVINRKDARGAAWTLTGYNFPDSATIELTAAKPLSLEIGEPSRSVLQTRETSGQVAFVLSLQGKLGESIEMLRGGEKPRGPRLILTGLDGSYHYTNNFEFG